MTHPHQKFYDQKIITGKKNRGTGNGGQKPYRNRSVFDEVSSLILIYQITTRTTLW